MPCLLILQQMFFALWRGTGHAARINDRHMVREFVVAQAVLYTRIKDHATELTPAQTRIAQHISQDPQRLAHSTIRELSAAVGVSNSAIVRFAQALGFDGFPALQAAARDLLAERLSMVERFASSRSIARSDQVEEILMQDLRNLQLTSRDLSRDDLVRAAQAIVTARRVYVLGYRNAAAMGILLSTTLSQVLDTVVPIAADFGDVADRAATFSEADVVIAIAFPRYARSTVRLVDFARQRGCRIIALTDGPASPIAHDAELVFFAHVESTLLPYSYAGAVGLINAISVGVAREAGDDAARRLERWEEAVAGLDLLQGLQPSRNHARGERGE